MKTPQILALLLVAWVPATAPFPSDRRPAPGGRDKQASWDDVNVVAHGLLQLGQGLKEHVDKTKAQMRDVGVKLKALNGTLAELERRQQEQDRALKAGGEEVEERERLAAEARKQSEEMLSRMEQLEEKVDKVLTEPALESNHSKDMRAPFIQRIVAAQNRRIDQLVEKIQQQQDKLEKQSLHLQALQSKFTQKNLKSHRRRDGETALRGEAEQSNNISGSARDCHDLFEHGQRTSGVYTVRPQNSQPFNVLCEMTSGGGWTVIQKRFDGSQSFNQLWEGYKKGFGSLNGDFWLGLENIHSLTKQGQYVLQVQLSDWTGQERASRYLVTVGGEEEKFALRLEHDSSSGAQEEIIRTGASGVPFSTADRDNDLAADVNCAEQLSGGWWFSSCGESNLNGKYRRRPSLLRRQQSRRHGMFWTTTKGQKVSPKTVVLKIAPATVKQ